MLVLTDTESKNGISRVKLSGVSGFDVRKIFDCGQCFRFEPVENTEHEAEFSGIAHGRFISVAQDADDIYISTMRQRLNIMISGAITLRLTRIMRQLTVRYFRCLITKSCLVPLNTETA